MIRIDRTSAAFKILIPIFALITLITLALLLFVNTIVTNILEDYHRFAVSIHSREVKKILDRAITELISSKLLNEPVVADAKKHTVIEEVSSYWKDNDLQGIIVTTEGKTLLTLADAGVAALIKPSSLNNGEFHFDEGRRHIQGYAMEFPIWNWKIITVSAPKNLHTYKNKVKFLIPVVGIGSIAMILAVAFVLHRNFRQPVKRITDDIQSGREISTTGITELDAIGKATNNAFRSLFKKTEQCRTLHSIATSLHEFSSTDELLDLIIDKASQLISAEVAAIALFNEAGKFKKIIARGASFGTERKPPEGKGVLEFTRLALTPVRINNVAGHHAFSGSFPEGHPEIKSLLSHPILSGAGRPVGILYFANKPEGFTEEDEMLLKAIAADAAIALNKAESLMQLLQFKQVIDSAFDVIVITDALGYITYANPAFESVTGHAVSEVVGKRTSILNSGFHDEGFYKKLWETIKAGNVWRGEFINRRKNGEVYHASAVIFPIQTEEGMNYASIQRDITQEKRLYEQLLRAQKMEAIGTLAGGIAHDFNNLLTAILGYSEIMLSSSKEGDPFYKPASVIYNAAEKGADLAKKILLVTRKEKLETKPVDINAVVENCLELLQRSIPKNVEIMTNLSNPLPLIKADPSQLQQVIMNLAVNARDAMPEGGVLTLETAVVGTENGAANALPSEKNGFVKLSISDTGIGMDKDTQRKIFDPFFTTKETGKGTGLGLYIVHSVINNHGGYINLYSEPGKGTRFNIYLPITDAREDRASEESNGIEYLRGDSTILVIDDSADIRDLTRDMLEPLGYKVLSAESGNDGITIFRQMRDSISLVILDMIMPRMGGIEVFQALRTIDPEVKIILCSGYSYNGFAGIDTLLKNGAKAFLQKPFTRQAIARAIKNVLDA